MKRDSGDSWWDWRAKRTEGEEATGGDKLSLQETTSALAKLVERCVVLDNLSPASTVHTIRTALEQFGKVRALKLLKDCQTCSFTGIAFAEMEDKDHRDQVVRELKDYLLMIGQMPRPARALPATPELMVDHPMRRFPRKLCGRLVRPKDPGWEVLREIAIQENLHYALQSELIQLRKEDEMKLEKSQEMACQEHINKLKTIGQEKNSESFQVMRQIHGMTTKNMPPNMSLVNGHTAPWNSRCNNRGN